MPSREKLVGFAAWCQNNITGDEKGQAQIFLDRLFQAFGQPGCRDAGELVHLFGLYMLPVLI
jgi:hypothetical protein